MRKIILSLLMIFILVTQSMSHLNALTVTLDRDTSMSGYLTVKAHTDNLGAYHPEQGKRVYKINNQYGYCIESDVGLSDDRVYQDGQNAQDILMSKPNVLTTWKQKYDLLAALLSMVPTQIINNNKSEHIKWLVGQTMVWEITGEERKSDFTFVGPSRVGAIAYRDTYKWESNSDKQEFLDYYQVLEKKLMNYWKLPSFTSVKQNDKEHVFDGYDGTYYYTTLIDANRVLDNYDLSGGELVFERNGNNLKIKTKSLSPTTLTATLKSSFQLNAPIFWSDGNFQRTMTSGKLQSALLKGYCQLKVGPGNLEVIKKDNTQAPIANAVFDITTPSGKVTTHTTNQEGKIFLNQVESGRYKVVEKSAPTGYLIHSKVYSLDVYPYQTTTQTIVNEEPRGSIKVIKSIDISLTNQLLGDAYLKDNEYSLYAKENISNKSGSKVYFQKDQLVQKALTDEKGEILFSELYLGKYYLKETKSNYSTQLNTQVYNISLDYQDMHTQIITKTIQTENKVNSQRIQIFKQGESEGSAGIVEGLKGAEFTFVLNSDFEKEGFDKAKKYFVGSTDENGFLTTSLLPYGIYRVKETKTPEGYYGTNDFLITIDKDSSEYEIGYQIKKVTINNLPFESLLKIVKKDKENQKIILKEGATFKVKNLDTNEYVSYIDWSAFPNIVVDKWSTHVDGSVTLNTKLKAGHYQVEEIKAPDGYLVSHIPLSFEINDKIYDISNDGKTPITTVEFLNESVMGQVIVEKKGEVLTDFKDGKFIYQYKGLKGTKFEIYAKDDIVSPTGDKTVLYKQEELVDTIISDESGKAISKRLPLGEYECKEIEAPNGYVLNEEIKAFSLTYKDQITSIVYENIDIINNRQKVKVSVSKKDQDTFQYLGNAELTLYANKDIYNDSLKKIVNKGTIIETIQSSKDGLISFKSDLPIDYLKQENNEKLDEDINIVGHKNALFVIKETKQPDGYLSKKVHYYVDTSYTNQKEHILNYEYHFLNKQTQTEIHKLDAESSLDIKGAKLQVIDSLTNKVIDEWVSDGEGHKINGLIVDRNYVLHEVEAPIGYQIAPDIEFNIRDIDEIQQVYFMNSKIAVLGDEPVITDDYTIYWTYLVMIIGAISIIWIIRKKED